MSRPSSAFIFPCRDLVKTLKRTFLSHLFVIDVECGSYFGVVVVVVELPQAPEDDPQKR